MRAIRLGQGVGAVLALAGLGIQWGSWRWDRETQRAVTKLMSAPDFGPGLPTSYSRKELIGLPDPVIRYFEATLEPGQPIIRSATLTQKGKFATSPGRWAPFTAREHFSVSPRGFLWDARIRMMPGVTAFVHDRYLAGTGSIRGALGGFVPMIAREGTAEMATASLLRCLAEAVWFPTALLPSAGVRWEALDDASARATLYDGPLTVSMVAHFASDGSISRVRARRYREVKGQPPTLSTWIGQFRDYHSVANVMVPGFSEVGWVSDGLWSPYWSGKNTDSEFHYVRQQPPDGAPS